MSDARGEMTIRREEKRLERNKAKAKAAEVNMTETIAAILKDPRNKKTLARDAMDSTNDQGRRAKIFDKAGAGAYDDDHEIITGSRSSLKRPRRS